MARRKNVLITYKKLSKGCFGFAYPDKNLIELDKNLKGRKHLEILIHESLHILYPERDEAFIEVEAAKLTRILWEENYRRIDNSIGGKLQDGTK